MSYYFSLLRLAPRPTQFPFRPTLDGPWKVAPFTDSHLVEEFFSGGDGFRPNGVVKGMRLYQWEDSKRGVLEIFATNQVIHVSVHAPWTEVAKLYESLLRLEPELLIADDQTSVFYDLSAFMSFIRESAKRETDQDAGDSDQAR